MTTTKISKILKWFWGILLGGVAFVFLIILGVILFAEIPSFKELEHPESQLATQIISSDGVVLSTFHIQNRTNVAYEAMSPHLVQAVVSTEDVRFYNHSGIDTRSLFRVLFKTLVSRDKSQGGGSTITQQLAKTLYPRADSPSKPEMVLIKLREWVTAVKLERDYTKEEILTMYFNSIFFGSGAYGVRAAAETFFDKLPADLTIEESAMLVGMVNKPTRYNPALNPQKALERRNLVIRRMNTAGYITDEQAEQAIATPIKLVYQVLDHNAGLAPYLRDMIRRDMNVHKPERSRYSSRHEYSVDSLRWENDALYGWLDKNHKANGQRYSLDSDGLRIYTTVNSRMQKYAEEAVAEWLGGRLQKDFFREIKYNPNAPFSYGTSERTRESLMNQSRRWSDRYKMMKRGGCSEEEILRSFDTPINMRVFAWNRKGYSDTTMTPNDSIRYYKSFLRCAFAAIEPNTGYVRAYVGGPNYRFFKYDNCSQGQRQVGSTIKPFLYTLAMSSGMSPCDPVVNLPQTFEIGHGSWTPRSTDRATAIGQTVTLKWGLTNSSNNISAYLMQNFGPRAMVRMMHQMGIHSYVEPTPSLCVGAADLPPFEIISAYNIFPSGGEFINPLFVTRIEDSNGNIISEFASARTESINKRTAAVMINMMKSVVDNGTGRRLRSIYGLSGEIAGKTGTTNDNSDGWFIGYTPTITAGVWVGGENRQIHFRSGAYGQGANMALPIWGIWMKKCRADGTLGLSASDKFPESLRSSGYGCLGFVGDSEPQGEEQYYFE